MASFFLLIMTLLAFFTGSYCLNSTDACWRHTTTRGAGVPFNACPAGFEKSGLLCYPPCKDGYHGVGPVCWEKCAAGWTDEGVLCAIPLKIISADNSKCHWYDKCGLTFDRGCSNCPPNLGYTNDGCTCRRSLHTHTKDSYGRTAGVPMICSSDLDQSGALCYPFCPKNTVGAGPVCWSSCGGDYPVPCAGTMCGAQGFSCTAQIEKFIYDTLHTVEACESKDTVNKCLEAIAKEAVDFLLDGICSALP